MRLRTASTLWNVPARYGPCGDLSFFLSKKEPMVLRELVRFGPSIPVETVKACALIGLHMMMFDENSGRSEMGSCVSSSSLDENNGCSSSGHRDLVRQLISSYKIGRWQR